MGKPIELPPKWNHPTPLSVGELQRMRREFWETRVTGNMYSWSVIKTAAEALIAKDVEMCNTVLEAGGLVSPRGSLSVCYDELGTEYRLPNYCFSNPSNLQEEAQMREMMAANRKKAIHASGDDAPTVTLRMQVAPGERKFPISISSSATIDDVKEALRAHIEGLSEEQRDISTPTVESVAPELQRVIYCGKEQKGHTTLEGAGINAEHVIQVYLRKAPAPK